MLKSKTHFEQIPLEAVRKIVEEQAAAEITTEQVRVLGENKLEKDLLAAQSPVDSGFPHVFSGEVIQENRES